MTRIENVSQAFLCVVIMMIRSIMQGCRLKQHYAIFGTQTIPSAQSQREDMFPNALSVKHTPTHPAHTATGVLFNEKLRV